LWRNSTLCKMMGGLILFSTITTLGGQMVVSFIQCILMRYSMVMRPLSNAVVSYIFIFLWIIGAALATITQYIDLSDGCVPYFSANSIISILYPIALLLILTAIILTTCFHNTMNIKHVFDVAANAGYYPYALIRAMTIRTCLIAIGQIICLICLLALFLIPYLDNGTSPVTYKLIISFALPLNNNLIPFIYTFSTKRFRQHICGKCVK